MNFPNCMCDSNLHLQVYDEETLVNYQKKSYAKEIHEILFKHKITLPIGHMCFSIQMNTVMLNDIRYYIYASNVVRGRVRDELFLNGFMIKQGIKVTLYDFYMCEHVTGVVQFDESARFYEDGVSFPRIELQIFNCGGRTRHLGVREEIEIKFYKTLKFLVNRKENILDYDDLEKDCLTYLEEENVLCSLRLMTLIKYSSVYARKIKGIMQTFCRCRGLLLNRDTDRCICEHVKNRCISLQLFE